MQIYWPKLYERRERFNALSPGRERSAIFLYLNRHCYNGLVRYNASNKFNVPFGRYARPRFPGAEMRAFIRKTGRSLVEFAALDFRKTFGMLREGDVVYCDPPYIPLSGTANFTAYSGRVFGPLEQNELADLANETVGKGISLVISNHDTEKARSLYTGATRFASHTIQRFISCQGAARAHVPEMLAVYDGTGRKNRPFRVRPGLPDEIQDLAGIWLRSTEATRDFLSKEDRNHYRPLVLLALAELELWVVESAKKAAGFMMLDENKIEALILDVPYMGKGAGTALLAHARRRNAGKELLVDVNERNPAALGFYLAKGFHRVGRSETDGYGRPFPLIHLALGPGENIIAKK